jgi:hypothetical protein
MAIQKKSLINKLNTTKKAIVASSTKENPSVGAPVTARLGNKTRVSGGHSHAVRLTGFSR